MRVEDGKSTALQAYSDRIDGILETRKNQKRNLLHYVLTCGAPKEPPEKLAVHSLLSSLRVEHVRRMG